MMNLALKITQECTKKGTNTVHAVRRQLSQRKDQAQAHPCATSLLFKQQLNDCYTSLFVSQG